jgi:hypothetical protein
VRIVLSLREDYLGFLEEAAEHIPQILDARFRLAPLDLHAAEQAIVGPAAVRDPRLETRPFALDRQAISSILDYLSQRRTRTVGGNPALCRAVPTATHLPAHRADRGRSTGRFGVRPHHHDGGPRRRGRAHADAARLLS